MRVRRVSRAILTGAFMCLTAGSAVAATWHVDDDNCPGPGDGRACNPFCRIQAAINAATSGDVVLIHDGVYPEAGINLGSKELRIQSLNGPDYVMLTGAEGLYRIMTIAGGQTADTMILGLTFTNTTQNIRGLEVTLASPTVENCVFENLSTQGNAPAVHIMGSDAVFNDCIFRGNSALHYQAAGGAVNIRGADDGTPSNPAFNCCTFENNYAGLSGGAIHIDSGDGDVATQATFDGCLFRANSCSGYSGNQGSGGLSVAIGSGGSSFVDCTFRDHSTSLYAGGAVKVVNGPHETTLERCVFENNTSYGGQVNSLYIQRTGGFGGASADPAVVVVRACRFESNGGTGATLQAGTESSVLLVDSQFINNTSDYLWTGVVDMDLSYSGIYSFLFNCLFQGNTTSSGLKAPVSASGVLLFNCLFVDNHAIDSATAAALQVSYSTVRSCTFYNNSSPSGYAVAQPYSWIGSWVENVISWGGATRVNTSTVKYCNIAGGHSSGTNILDVDPMFVDPDGPDDDLSTWQDNDFSLMPGSPCIDSGNSGGIGPDLHDLDGDGDTTETIPFDFAGNPRRVDDPLMPDCAPFGAGNCGTTPLPDMGAFEGPPGAPLVVNPVSGNGCVPWASADTDGDGVPDDVDVCEGFDDCLDADADGVPDACDECPDDPGKVQAGDCGCGIPDDDSDGDGYANCIDGCPFDPNKNDPGVCSCGISDADSDNDGTPDCADGCPDDANKTHPGACGCGASDIDTDNDGIADCHDGCPYDSDKIAPGQCDCGTPDTDADGDGVADCNDGCPNDALKTEPGICACGTPDTDSDGDGTADCIDNCPTHANKTDPGQCGCALPDTDSDGDGTADCNDNCPSDPEKSDPGQCGCGVSDTDSDGDATADCADGCPNDPNKTALGACGCGVPDTDSDGDATSDCNDGCPSDPSKVEPGQCGCSNADTDTDNDGTADCNDGCPNDPGKTSGDVCGCGVPDEDSDQDGILDCVDPCPNDPDTDGDGWDDCEDICPTDPGKIDAGQCGCGVTDIDTDADGTADCLDGCPTDADKTEPGQCDCGEPDTDNDGDSIANCNDGCPEDVNKVVPGACGCGVSDADSDSDGTADCMDSCPNDPTKAEPGHCGCGNADTDTDNDGTPDCNDGCPNDPNKIEVAICGCGVADADSDGDGTADCIDGCPGDPNKTDSGLCGCGDSDTDSDDDGVADCIDGCPEDGAKTIPGACGCGLPDTDGDGDGVANCIDNCPTDANPDQADADNDGLGDVCDNQPPTADAGPDQAVDEGAPVMLDGGLSSDPDNDAVSYEWTQLAGPTITLDTSDPVHPTFIAPAVPVGGTTLTFQLVVNDGQFSSEPAAVNVVVKNVNHAPIALAGTDQTVAEDTPVTLSGTDSYDPDTDPLSYSWIQIVGPTVTLSGADTVEASFTVPFVGSDGETLAFSLTVSDGSAQSTDSVIVFVENVNHAPTADAGDDQTQSEGTVVTLDGTGSSDPDSDALSYAWLQTAGPTVVLSDASSVAPIFTAPAVALTENETLSFVLTVDDGLGGAASDEVLITVLDTNAPPACELAQPSKPMLWPPNHKLVPVAIVGVSDPEDGDVSITIVDVTQDEPINGLGDGDTSPDAVIQDGAVLLRAERAGIGNGRVYHVHFEADDGEGGVCTGVVTVCVPHDKGNGSTSVDDGQSYSSIGQ